MSAYLMRLVCAAMLCAAVNALSGSGKGLRGMLCGLFLVLTALSPLGELELPELDVSSLRREAEQIAAEGQEQARQAEADIIIGSCEAYICSEAEDLGLELQVRVELDDELLPEAVTLTGDASPQERERMEKIITRELKIREEEIKWTELHQSGA